MDRRKFLLGTAATAAATCLGKPALGPISKSLVLRTDVAVHEVYGMSPAMMALPDMEALIDRLTQPLAKEFERCIMEGNPYRVSWVEDRFQVKSIPLGDLYA